MLANARPPGYRGRAILVRAGGPVAATERVSLYRSLSGSEIAGMDGILLIARLLLAGVFAVAGAAKLTDLAGTRRALAGFGIPDRLGGSLALALPLAELAIAVAL